MILTVGNIKGGVGKTTLAVNLAIVQAASGRDVLLVDGDEQGTAITFTELRTQELGAANYTAVRLQGKELRTQVRQLAPKYEDIVIDVGGRDTGSLRAALTVSNTLLIPVQPRSFDLWSLEQIAEQVKEAREVNSELRAFVVLNMADAQGRDNKDAADIVKGYSGLELLNLTIARRKAFSNSAAFGRAVTEQAPKDPKAIEELHALARLLYVSEYVS